MSLALLAPLASLALLASGCGQDRVCGPGDAPAAGVTTDIGGQVFSFGQFTSSPNNDCTPPDGELTSVTLDGLQIEPVPPMQQHITFCLPRPEQLGDGPIELPDERVQVIDVFANDGACQVSIDRAVTPMGTIDLTGYCDDAADPAGYAVSVDLAVGITRACGVDPPESLTVTVTGAASVQALNF
jgi:hypothetical protein